MTENKNILFYARRAGTIMGVFWIAKFALLPLGFSLPFLQMIFLLLTLMVPIVAYKLTKNFRDRTLGGYIKFSQAWSFTITMYLFASLLTAMAHYIYFRFIDHGFLLGSIQDIFQQFSSVLPKEETDYISDMQQSIDAVSSLSPIKLTLQMMSNNLFYGVIFSLIIAFFVKRAPKNNQSI